MKVLFINGSPHRENGCCGRAIAEMVSVLDDSNISHSVVTIGNGPFEGCRACGFCKKERKCVINDLVNETAKELEKCDAIVLLSPVHYAGISGIMKTFLDRLYFSSNHLLQGKPGVAVVSCRRAGSSSALDQLNKYFGISHQTIVSGNYWNMVHGANAEDVEKDEEGLQNLRELTRNLVHLIKSKADVSQIEREKRMWTNFIQ